MKRFLKIQKEGRTRSYIDVDDIISIRLCAYSDSMHVICIRKSNSTDNIILDRCDCDRKGNNLSSDEFYKKATERIEALIDKMNGDKAIIEY